MIGLSRLERAIADVPKGGMQTGSPKVSLKLADAERIKIEMNHLITERDALAAQVALLREAYKELSGAINDLDDCESDTEEFEQASANVFAVMQHGYNNALRATPQQHLAEIRANAIESAVTYLAESVPDESHESVIFKDRYVYISNRYLREYADKVRQGGAE